ncbi:pilus assembly protein TadG-related protein [Kocuria sp. CH-021]|uniref:pilus assembly protein TadG-related protein n=1 Tax=Kocuria sp. CH-021 TaxID=3406735 RepID=UPI003C70BF8C
MGEERGGVSVVVAVALVALLGFAALVIDVGALYAERAELQSGTDAAALAVAQDCAGGNCGDATATAKSLADQNAKDGAASVDAPVFPTSNSVRVRATTLDGNTGAGSLALSFAPVLGIDEATVAAVSTASWGSPAGGPAMLPLAFAPCVFDLNGGVQVIQTHGTSSTPSCTSTSPSGATLPGGFSWLDSSTGACESHMDIDDNAFSDPGNNIPSECTGVFEPSLVGQTLILPLYDDTSGTGSGATYHVSGWVAFKIHGWRFPGNSLNNNSIEGAKCVGSCNGLIGEFIEFTDLSGDFTLGGPNLGVTVVALTE